MSNRTQFKKPDKGYLLGVICAFITVLFSKAIGILYCIRKKNLYNIIVLRFIKLEQTLAEDISDDPRVVKEMLRYRAELLSKILALEREPYIVPEKLLRKAHRYSEKSLYQIQSAIVSDIEKVNARLADEYLSNCELYDIRQNMAVLITENMSICKILEKKYLENLISTFGDYGLIPELVSNESYGNLREED